MLSNPILFTLLYHSIFDYPLTIDEIHRYLISDRAMSLAVLIEEINSLLKTGKIISIDDFFFPSSFVKLRPRRQKTSAEKMIIAKQASRAISVIPWVKMVAVTGALAMENVDENDDIDLMIVASKNRLWIARPLAIILISIFFKRRFPLPNAQTNNQKPTTNNNAICLNLWLDESALEIPIGQRNLYTAHELAQMKPIVDRGGTYERMMRENRWGRKYLANAWKKLEGRQVDRLERPNSFSLFNLLNLLAFRLQFWYMKPKMTDEHVSLHSAFFHPGNRADTILNTYDRLCHRSF